MKRMTLMLLLFLLSVTTVFGAEPKIAARGAALIDGKTGRLLWGRNAEEPMAMASTTKIMTAIMVLENCRMDEVVTISKNAAHQP
ncbi:MAG: D-alanyl-D-alanine carboxypeptidase, partial [Anaerotignum sp.]|nr:D-alanyl-D-alanine carboxypeptidase [Anaerotignum sp.]